MSKGCWTTIAVSHPEVCITWSREQSQKVFVPQAEGLRDIMGVYQRAVRRLSDFSFGPDKLKGQT